MQIALISCESRRELLVRFCIAYKSILKGHTIFSTKFCQGEEIFSELKVEGFFDSRQGGLQQLAARVACNEVDLLVYFRDPSECPANMRAEQELFRLCDRYQVPYSTNLATAEILIQGLKRGDFEWRNLVKAGEWS